jgi:hypothetical protein
MCLSSLLAILLKPFSEYIFIFSASKKLFKVYTSQNNLFYSNKKNKSIEYTQD